MPARRGSHRQPQQLSSSGSCLAVFLKAPEPGKVKTRLAASIGAVRAAGLYRAFVLDTLEWAAACPVSARRIDHEPPEAAAQIRSLIPPQSPGFELFAQQPGDLGARMQASFESMFAAGHERCVIVGTDCPALGRREVKAALEALRTANLVLGPTSDGGYYLIAASRPAPEVFQSVPWSTADVLETTLDRAARAGLTVHQLDRLDDVDTVADLPALRLLLRGRHGCRDPFPRHTLRFVEQQLDRFGPPEESPRLST